MAQVITNWTYNGIGPGNDEPWYWELGYEARREHDEDHSINGTLHLSYAAWVTGRHVSGSGPMLMSDVEALLAILDANTAHTLETTHGSCTARLVKVIPVPRPGDCGAADALADVTVSFVRESDWS